MVRADPRRGQPAEPRRGVDFVTRQLNDFAWMGLRSELYNDVAPILTYFNRARLSEGVEADSTKGEADVVKSKDWNGADTIRAWPTHATMTNTANTYSFLATSFDYVQSMVYKQRRLGLDTAYLYGT
ncbi:MAG: hypothetical protein KJZ87_29140, partial [Thermoguttaceae bacterium]|nr:hypothetical protein [Thermoguttaceae bacterium]